MAGSNAGRSGGTYRRLVQQIRMTERICYQCGQPLDWSIPYRDEHGNINTMAGTIEHKQPLSTHPHLAEDPGNLAASHARCNMEAGNRNPKPSLGVFNVNW